MIEVRALSEAKKAEVSTPPEARRVEVSTPMRRGGSKLVPLLRWNGYTREAKRVEVSALLRRNQPKLVLPRSYLGPYPKLVLVWLALLI